MVQSFTVLQDNLYIDEDSRAFSLNPSLFPPAPPVIDLTQIARFVPRTAYSFCLAVSDRCNLRCSYCFNKSKSGQRMSLEQAKDILNNLFSLFPDGQKYFVDLSGIGEPLLNLDVILPLADYCHEISNRIMTEVLPQFVCNGTLLTPKVAKLLQDHEILFGVSLDGNEEINDRYRGKGTFKTVLDNVMSIANRDYIGCAATIGNDSFPLLESIDELGKIFKTLSYRFVRGDGFRLDLEHAHAWVIEYERLSRALLHDALVGDDSRFLRLMNGDDWFGRFLCRFFGNKKTINRCDGGITRFAFDLDGFAYPCSPSVGLPGTIIESSVLINAGARLEEQARECPDCLYKTYCGGPCAIEKDAIGGPNPAECYLTGEIIKFSAYIALRAKRDNPDFYMRLQEFAAEKSARYVRDPALDRYLKSHPNLSFVEGKKAFDKEVHRY